MLGNFSVWNIVTPALVAAIITLYVNILAEKKRAERDFITKLFDASREDVRRAMEASVDYFSSPVVARTPLQEAKVWMGERDVRHSVTGLIAFSTEKCGARGPLQAALDDFIDAVTGGSFQSAAGEADLEQARKVASKGAELKAAIAAARQLELHVAVRSDVFARSSKAAMAYLKEDLGPRNGGL